jgi:hypothetical protein
MAKVSDFILEEEAGPYHASVDLYLASKTGFSDSNQVIEYKTCNELSPKNVFHFYKSKPNATQNTLKSTRNS